MKTALIYDEMTPDGRAGWVEAEYESPETIQALLDAIAEHCDEAVAVPFDEGLIGRLHMERPDLAFNIAEGRAGASRETIVPCVLEYLQVPYTGSDGVALGVSLNKAMTKQLAMRAGVPTPEFSLFRETWQVEEAAGSLPYPVLAKPNYGGSSVGIELDSVVEGPDRLVPVVQEHLRVYEQPCLVERYVRGSDVTVGLLGSEQGAGIEVLPVGRIEAPDGLYSAHVKQSHERRVLCPCDLPEGVEEQLIDWALRVYRAIGARDFARVDFMVDEGGEAHFLEINPLPGLSPFYGVYPVLATAAGYDHSALIGRIMEVAMDRYARKTRSMQHGRLATAVAQQHHNC